MDGAATSRRAAPLAAAAVLAAGFAVTVAVLTPWHPLPGAVPGGHVTSDAAREFTAVQLARAARYHDEIRPWGLLALALSVVVPVLLGLTPWGARLVGAVARRRSWLLSVLAGVLLVVVAEWVVTIPIGAREHVILRRYGLSTQGWTGWWSDEARGFAVSLVATVVGVVAVAGLARRFPRRWWAAAAATGALLVMVGSYVYPYVVEPVFNRFTPMSAGPLRDRLVALAARDGVPLHDILVADASRRTTAENAHVSGFGASRRLVLDDTLLRQDTPDEVALVTAHELGHAKRDDVLVGTVEGALAVAAVLCLAGAVVGRGAALPRRVGSDGAGDPRAVPLLLALFTVGSLVASPLTNLISRHIEARADAHSLQLTSDPATFVTAQRQLAVSGLDAVHPNALLFTLFATHPAPLDRIDMARDFARQRGLPQPPAVPAP